MKFAWRSLAIVIFIILLLGIQIFYWIDPVTVSDIIQLRKELLSWINQHYIISALIYISSYTISIIFGIPISATVIGGYLFGIIKGIIYSIIAITLGTIILCSLARYVLRDWIQKRYKKQLEPFNKEIKKYGLHYIVMVHIIPFMPSFLPHIATGISTISLPKIIGINILGALPLTCVYTIAGSYIHQLDSMRDIIYYFSIFGSVLGIFFLLSIIYRRVYS